MAIQYYMRGYHTTNPVGYVNWVVNNTPDTTGAYSPYPGVLTNIIISNIINTTDGYVDDRAVSSAPPAGYGNLANLIRNSNASGIFTVWSLGDSVSAGYGEDRAGSFGFQAHMHRALSSRRADVASIGSLLFRDWSATSADARVDADPGEYAPQDWEHDGHTGNTIAQITTGVPTWFASAGSIVPDVITLMCGGNTGGLTAAQNLALLSALRTAIRAVAPNAHVIQSTITLLSDPTYMSAFNGGLAATITAFNDPKWHYVDIAGKLTAADITVSGHPNLQGYAILGITFADEIEKWLPPRKGQVFPRLVRRRVNATDNGIRMVAASDKASGTNANCEPGAGSFAVEGWFTPTTLPEPDGIYRAIVQYGSGATNVFSLVSNGKSMSVYLASGGPDISYTPGCFGAVGEPVHWFVHCYRNGANSVVSLWVNGILRGILKGKAAWTIAAGASFNLGSNVNYDALPGIHSDVRFYKGSAGLPAYGVGLRQLIQSCYADGVPLTGCTAYFKCDEAASPCIDTFGGTSLTLTGAAMVGQAQPGGQNPANARVSATTITSPREVGSANTLWLRGDTGTTIVSSKVSSYYDQSGSTRTFAQGTAGNRPVVLADGINGRPTISFRIANTSKLTCTSALSTLITASQWHVFIVAQFATIVATGGPPFYVNDSLISISDGATVWGISARVATGTPKVVGHYRTTAPAYVATPEVTIATGIPYIFEFSRDGTNTYLRVTGGVLGTTSQAEVSAVLADQFAVTGTAINLGVAYDGTTYSDVDIGEVIVCNKRLTVPDATRMRNMLRDYYKI